MLWEIVLQAKQAGSKETIRRGALMKMLLITAQTLPLWISKTGQQPPALCGAVPADPTYVAKVWKLNVASVIYLLKRFHFQLGDIVAALVKSTDGDENWILAEVVQYLASSGRYEVDDIDEEQKERHTLSKRRIIPLPLMRANPETDPDALFPKGATGKKKIWIDISNISYVYPVLAMYSHGSIPTNDLFL